MKKRKKRRKHNPTFRQSLVEERKWAILEGGESEDEGRGNQKSAGLFFFG